MARTESFVLELELSLTPHEKAILKKRLSICTQIYNACLREALKRLHKVQADQRYRTLLEQKKSRERTQKLREIELLHGYSEYQLHNWSLQCYRHFHRKIGSSEVQKLATRAFRAVESLHYHQAKKVNFKGKNDLITAENKSNRQGLRWYDGKVLWGELSLGVRIRKNDHYATEALKSRTKYIRIVPRVIRGKERFFVQFIQEGLPPAKQNRTPGSPEGTVGIYTDVSTAAVVSSTHVELAELSPITKGEEKKLRQVLQAMDRSRRATNANNFNEKGKVKKGRRTWTYSNRYRKLKAKRRELHRKISAKRKQSHEELANRILKLGLDIRTTDAQHKAPRTFFTQHQAPATFLLILDRKLHYYGSELKKISPIPISAGTDPVHNWIPVEDQPIQRNLYQAYLLANLTDTMNNPNQMQPDETFQTMHQQAILYIKEQGSKTLKQYIA